MNSGFDVNLHHKQGVALVTQGNECLYGGAAGGGKGSELEDYVLTPFGFKQVQDLKLGDAVNNPDGTVAKVIQLHPIMDIDGYNVKFHDGTEVKVSRGHLWKAWRSGKRKKKKNIAVFGENAAEIVEVQVLKEWCDYANDQNERGIRPNWALTPVCEEQSFNVAYRFKVDIDPYLLGALLGDGCITETQKNISFATIDFDHFLPVMDSLGFKCTRSKDDKSFIFIGDKNKDLRSQLQKCGLRGTNSSTKFIPRQFKLASIDDRWALLAGLMDTDGTVDDRGHISYCTVSKKLSDDIKFLVSSLGGIDVVATKDPFYRDEDGNKVMCKLAYIHYIKFRDYSKVFRLARKIERTAQLDFNMYRRVVSVEPCGKIQMRCITVSHPNGLYITNDFIVTHNSHLMRYASVLFCLAIPGLQVYLFRRKYNDLQQNHLFGPTGYAVIMQPFHEDKKAKINYSDNRIDFANGSRIFLRHCQHEKDVYNYQGAEIHMLMIDELTHFSTKIYTFLRSRVRLGGFKIDYDKISQSLPFVKQGFFPRILCGTNPGGIGHCVPYGDVLTTNGWKLIQDMCIGDEVYSVTNDRKLCVKKVEDTVHFDFDGDLRHVKNDSFELLCTGKHKIPHCVDNDGELILTEFDDLHGDISVIIVPDKIVDYDGTLLSVFNSKSDVTKERYNGKVHCITVPDTHTFILRQNGCISVTGNSWVKQAWVDSAPPMKIWKTPSGDGMMNRVFIPATLIDNPTMQENDPEYAERLRGLSDPALAEAMLSGNWDIVSGGAVDDVWNRKVHVIDPFDVPKDWQVDRTFDWGSAKPFAVCYWAESNGNPIIYPNGKELHTPPGTVFLIDEIYGWNGTSNEGCKFSARKVGDAIRKFEATRPYRKQIIPGAADSSIWADLSAREDHESILDNIMFGYNVGIDSVDEDGNPIPKIHTDGYVNTLFVKADKSPGSRVKGLELVRSYLQASLDVPMEEKGMFIFDKCIHFIRTVPILPRSENNPEDVDTDAEDHIFDCVRYRLLTKVDHFQQLEVLGI